MRAGQGIVDAEWYQTVLKNPQSVIADEAHVRSLFDRAFTNRNKPAGMSLWVERKTDGTVVYYLSPVCVTTEPGLVHNLSAVRSAPPSNTSYLIAGDLSRSR